MAKAKVVVRTADLRFGKQRGFPSLDDTVEILELSGTNVGKIPSSIGKLTALRELGLDSANVSTIDPVLAKLPLHRLDLRYNEKLELPKAFPPELRELRLCVAGTDPADRLKLKPKLFALPQLRTLQLDGLLAELPTEVAKHAQLEELAIDGNQFRELPPLELPALVKLDLADLGMLVKAPELATPVLRHLKFSGRNSSTRYPESNAAMLAPIWKLTQLESLEIGGWKQLTKLPAALGDFKRLKRLELESTGITKLPAVVLGLNQLEVLDLRFMELAKGEIERALDALPNVSLMIDDSDWPEVPDPPQKIQTLLAKTEINGKVWYAKGNAQMKLLLGAVDAACDVLDAVDADKYPLAAGQAYYALLRYGLVALETAKQRDKLLARLVEHARAIFEQLPASIPIRSAADSYFATVRPKAAAILAIAAREDDELDEALRLSEIAVTDYDYSGSRSPQLRRIEVLVELDRVAEAARHLRKLIGDNKHDKAIQRLKTKPWYVGSA